MKIDETPFTFGRKVDNTRLAKSQLPMQGLDELELSFLELLASNSPETASAVTTEGPINFSGRVQVVEREQTSNTKTTEKSVEKPVASAPEQVSAADSKDPTQVQKELELLKVDMTADDLSYLKTVVIPALPILQGSVPIQQALETDASGKLDTRGLTVSSKLTELIEQGIRSGRPIRVELDGDASVVLKFKNGRVSAEFLSNDKATAMYLKQNLDELRSRLEAKNLPVDLLQYRDQRQGRPKKDPGSKD